jgi:predicted NUDIX family NTP pyrophosphohydrolase
MAKRVSAGVLLYRVRDGALEVFLVHPGGPFWRRKDEGAWSIPKGEVEEGAEPLATALREFEEETGTALHGEGVPLSPVRQPGGKLVRAWAVEGDIDPASIVSNTFAMEWPPRSGRRQSFPEVDRAGWFTLAQARTKILAGQQGLVDQLEKLLRGSDGV